MFGNWHIAVVRLLEKIRMFIDDLYKKIYNGILQPQCNTVIFFHFQKFIQIHWFHNSFSISIYFSLKLFLKKQKHSLQISGSIKNSPRHLTKINGSKILFSSSILTIMENSEFYKYESLKKNILFSYPQVSPLKWIIVHFCNYNSFEIFKK